MNLLYYTSGRAIKDIESFSIEKNKETQLINQIETKKINYLKLSQGFKDPYDYFNELIKNKNN